MRTHPRHYEYQKGISLLQVMLMIVLIGAITATGFQILNSRKSPSQAVNSDQAMAWADQAVASFAAANSRLPCPASTPKGAEDCSAVNSRGYLPVTTIDSFFDESARSLIGASAKGVQSGPILYAVSQTQMQGSEPVTLLTAGSWYQPLTYDDDVYKDRQEYEREGDTLAYNAINGLDFCMALARLSVQPFNNARLNISRGSETRNIAYAVGIAGLSEGAAQTLKPDSNGNQILLEGQREALFDNDHGQVRVRTLASLGQSVGCELFAKQRLAGPRPEFADSVPVAVMDLAADALDLNEQVEATEAETLSSANENLSSAKTAMLLASISTVMAGVSTVTSYGKTGEDSILLSLHSLRCIVTLGAECWRVPITSTALGLDIAALVAAGAAFVATATEAGLTGKALADAQTVQQMAESAAKPATFDMTEALEQARQAIYGDCSERDEEGKCHLIGTEENLENARDTYAAATRKKQSFYDQYLLPWSEAQLLNRINRCQPSLPDTIRRSATDCNTSRLALSNKLQLSRKLMDELIILDNLKGELRGYQDKRKQIDDMLKPSGPFADSTADYCGTDEEKSNPRRCAANRESVTFARTCVRNGVEHQYNGTGNEFVPLCYARIDEAIADVKLKITQQEGRYRTALAAATRQGVGIEAARLWVPEVLDADGNVIKAGYYTSSSPSDYRYPSGWTYCSAGKKDIDDPKSPENRIEGCTELTVLWSWWKSGDHLPLVRTSNDKWFSYGDAYRASLGIAAEEDAARKAAEQAKTADDQAKEAYALLKSVVTSAGKGSNVELWIGPHEILKAMDDRGSVGPDRNGLLQSGAKP